jgi:hypothetical protein
MMLEREYEKKVNILLYLKLNSGIDPSERNPSAVNREILSPPRFTRGLRMTIHFPNKKTVILDKVGRALLFPLQLSRVGFHQKRFPH